MPAIQSQRRTGLIPWAWSSKRIEGVSFSYTGGTRLVLLFFGCVFLWAGTTLPAQPSATAQSQVLRGHVPKITRKLSPLGRLDANYRMEVAIGLPLRNRE